MSKSPSFQFYANDWLGDPALRRCSMAAHGLWIGLLCIMHQGNPYGHLTLPNGQPLKIKDLPKFVPFSIQKVSKTFPELIQNGVISVTENGVFYSKRMVEDEAKRLVWRERQAKHRYSDVTRDVTGMSRPSSSSSSSSNGSNNVVKNNIGLSQDKPAKPKKSPKKATEIPEDWQPSSALGQWARETYPQGNLADTVLEFRNHHRARQNTFVDVDAAFRAWILKAKKWHKGANEPNLPPPSPKPFWQRLKEARFVVRQHDGKQFNLDDFEDEPRDKKSSNAYFVHRYDDEVVVYVSELKAE